MNCGCATPNLLSESTKDSGSIGWGFLRFFFPIVGFILWLVWNDSAPRNAKKAGIGALVGVISSVAAVIAYYVLIFMLMFLFV